MQPQKGEIPNIKIPNSKEDITEESFGIWNLNIEILIGAVAQLVEQRTENPCVAGSIPAHTTTTKRCNAYLIRLSAFFYCPKFRFGGRSGGQIVKKLQGFTGSNPLLMAFHNLPGRVHTQ